MEFMNQFGAIFGVSVVVAGGIISFIGIGKRNRQDIVRQDNADLRASNQEMRTEKAGMEATINESREQIRQLRDIATQTPAVTQLIDLIKQQQELSSTQHTDVMGGLTDLTAKISDLATVISKGNNRHE